MSLTLIGQSIVSGIVLGSIYLLIALGINIIFGVMKILNFSQTVFTTVAMYLILILFSSFSIDPYIALLIVVPILFIIGVFVQLLLIKPILETSFFNHVVLTVGLFFVVKALLSLIFTENFFIVKTGYRVISYEIGGIIIGLPHLIAIVASISLTVILYMLLEHTDFGRSLRAISQSREGALACGVDANKIFSLSFGIGIALAGVAGCLISTFYPIYPHVGDPFLLSGFVIVVLGGLGSFKGCLVGSYIIALTESFIAFHISPAFQHVASLILFLIILLVRPRGLFGGRFR